MAFAVFPNDPQRYAVYMVVGVRRSDVLVAVDYIYCGQNKTGIIKGQLAWEGEATWRRDQML
jgi:hypothetical protein